MTTPVAVTALARATSASHAGKVFASGGLCCHAEGYYYGLDHSGSPSARDHWNAIPGARKYPPSQGRTIAGGLGFFVSPANVGNGHEVLLCGDGTAFTTDMAGDGTVSRHTIDEIAAWCGLPFVGAADPLFPGAGKDFGVLVPPLSRHEAHMRHLRVVLSRHLRHLAHIAHIRRHP